MGVIYHDYKRHAVVAGFESDGKSSVHILPIHNGLPVTEIKDFAFRKAEISEVFFPPTLMIVGNYAFQGCAHLERLHCSSKPALPFRTVGEAAFRDCPLTGVLSFDNNFLELGKSAFQGCHMEHIAISGSNVALSTKVFKDCAWLKSVVAYTARISTIPVEAFSGCRSLHSVAIPHVKAVSSHAFSGCQSLVGFPLEKVTVADNAFEDCPLATPKKPDPHDCWKEDTLTCSLDDLQIADDTPQEEVQVEPGGDPFEKILEMKPMLLLKIQTLGNSPLRLGEKLYGFLHVTMDGLAFRSMRPSITDTDLIVEADPKFRPLLRLLSQKKSHITITGKMTDLGDIYKVYDMEISPKAEPALGKELFRLALLRIHHTDAKAVTQSCQHHFIRGIDEVRSFYAVAAHILPGWVRAAVDKELSRYENLAAGNTDERRHSVSALELLLNVNWDDNEPILLPNLDECQDFLDSTTHGMSDQKAELMQVLAFILRTRHLPQQNLLFVGPPGCGKTFLATKFGELLNLPVCRIDFSSGMTSNNAESIVGSSRMYTNARPGDIAQAFLRHRTSRVMMFFNELDKAADSTSTLLSLLDSTNFRDQFLECHLEVSPFCIATANSLEQIPGPLRSRFRTIVVPGYTDEERHIIFTRFSLPNALKRQKLRPDSLSIMADAELLKEYTLGTDARELDKLADRLASYWGLQIARHPENESANRILSADDLRKILGPGHAVKSSVALHPGLVQYHYSTDSRICTGMLEASVLPGTGRVDILGTDTNIVARDAIRAAYLAIRRGIDLSEKDVTFFLVNEHMGDPRFVGGPAYIALWSALLNRTVNWDDRCLLGFSIDLHGFCYPGKQENNLTALVRQLPDTVKTVYGPCGFSGLIDVRKIRKSPIFVESHRCDALMHLLLGS